MRSSDLDRLEAWFREFVSAYRYDNPEDQANMDLKVLHTWRVADNMLELAAALAGASTGAGNNPVNAVDTVLARAIGVLHDTGRFPQYDKYRTFRDAESVNHGVLGAGVLKDACVLDGLESGEAEIILSAVKYHSCFALPVRQDPRKLMYMRLIRDADKLDVWRVLADHYESSPDQRRFAVGQGLEESPGCSDEALAYLDSGRMVPISTVRNYNDMRLLYASWVYDLHYAPTCAMALERGDLSRIAAGLRGCERSAPAIDRALRVLKDRAAAH